VDVAAVRPDELEPDDDAPVAPGRNRSGLGALTATLVVLAALIAVLVVLLVRASRGDADDARIDAARAARAEALNLTTISYRTAGADLRRILGGATGKLRAQFAEEQPHFAEALGRDKSVSKGNVLAVGVVPGFTSDRAGVVIAIDATVSTVSAGGQHQSVLKHYRMAMRLVKLHGRWLVSDVAFAGAPQ
jgi:Mce-associated membrane protein